MSVLMMTSRCIPFSRALSMRGGVPTSTQYRYLQGVTLSVEADSPCASVCVCVHRAHKISVRVCVSRVSMGVVSECSQFMCMFGHITHALTHPLTGSTAI